MNKYTELKNNHSRLINEFPMAFAFSEKQFKEAQQKLGVSSPSELLATPTGGMIRKTDQKSYIAMMSIIRDETREYQADDEYLYQGFLYEFVYHEFFITYDPSDTLDCFGLTLEEVRADKRVYRIFKKAQIDYLQGVEA